MGWAGWLPLKNCQLGLLLRYVDVEEVEEVRSVEQIEI